MNNLPDLFTDLEPSLLDNTPQKPVFRWVTVANLSPLQIQLDYTTAPLAAHPCSLIADLKVGDRVWAMLINKKIVILGRATMVGPPPRIPLDSSLTWGAVATEFTIMRNGYWREIRGAITGNLPTGTTAITNWWALAEEDRPFRNAFSYAYLGGNHPGAFLARPDGQMALINQSGAARNGTHQFTLVYSVD